MKDIHKNLEPKEFSRPESGLITIRVCADSGLLPTSLCTHTINEVFLTGTEPRKACDVHPYENERDQELLRRMQNSILIEDIPLYEMNLPSLGNLQILQDMNALPGNGGDYAPDNENPLLD